MKATGYMKECLEIIEHLGLKNASVTRIQINIASKELITVDTTLEITEEQFGKIIRSFKTIKFIEEPTNLTKERIR